MEDLKLKIRMARERFEEPLLEEREAKRQKLAAMVEVEDEDEPLPPELQFRCSMAKPSASIDFEDLSRIQAATIGKQRFIRTFGQHTTAFRVAVPDMMILLMCDLSQGQITNK